MKALAYQASLLILCISRKTGIRMNESNKHIGPNMQIGPLICMSACTDRHSKLPQEAHRYVGF